MIHDFAGYDYVVGFQSVGIFHVLFVAQLEKLDIQIILNVWMMIVNNFFV